MQVSLASSFHGARPFLRARVSLVSLVFKGASSWRNSVFEGASFLGFVRSLGRGAFKSASVLGFEVS